MSSTTTTIDDTHVLQSVQQFLAREARLADAHDHEGWLALWEDDGVYSVPTSASLDDPLSPAIVRDDRRALGDRIERLGTGLVHSQTPRSEVARVLGPCEVARADDGVLVEAPFTLVESRPRGVEVWGGRYHYRLRRRPGGDWGIVAKTVVLVNRDAHLPPLTFLV